MSTKSSRRALKKKVDTAAEQKALMLSSRKSDIEKLADSDLFVVDTEGTEPRTLKAKKRAAIEALNRKEAPKKIKPEAIPGQLKPHAPIPHKLTKREKAVLVKRKEDESTMTEDLESPEFLKSVRLVNAVIGSKSHEFIQPAGVDHDLWADDNSMELNQYDPEIIKAAAKKAPYEYLQAAASVTIKNKRRQYMDGHTKKNSLIVAPAGMSINPDPKDHAELLKTINERVEIQKQHELRLLTRLTGSFDVREPKVLSEREINEISHYYEPVVNQPIQVVHRTAQEKNKEKRRRYERALFDRARYRKKFAKEFDKIPEYVTKLEDKMEKDVKKREFIEKMREIRSSEAPVRIGRFKFNAPVPTVAATSELNATGSMRGTVVVGDLLQDSFYNLQRKGLISATGVGDKPLKHRKKSRSKESRESREFKHTPVSDLLSTVETETKTNPRQSVGPKKTTSRKKVQAKMVNKK